MNYRSPVLVLVCLCWFGMILSSASAPTAELKLKAQLIWATDEEKPKDKPLKELDAELRNKLRRFSKWTNYWEISSKEIGPVTSTSQKHKLSRKCETELKKIDETTVEVKLYGEGKLVKTVRQPVKLLLRGEYLVLGGDDKEKYDDAWFVVFSLTKP
jgi:hypothetical protein